MKNQIKKVCLLLMMLFVFPLAAEEERHIHVNGEHLAVEDIVLMDQLFNQQVPNNNYWINFQTGQWGYEGVSQVEGVVNAITQYSDTRQTESNSTEFNTSQNGSVVSGKLDGKDCTFVSVSGMTMKSCD